MNSVGEADSVVTEPSSVFAEPSSIDTERLILAILIKSLSLLALANLSIASQTVWASTAGRRAMIWAMPCGCGVNVTLRPSLACATATSNSTGSILATMLRTLLVT